MTSRPRLIIGTRGSPLALAQAELTRAALVAVEPDLGAAGAVEIRVIKTEGDRILDRTLADIGGKGLFTEEIEAGLVDGTLDIAVHSMKDMPTSLPDALVIGAMLPREDVRDALIAPGMTSLAALPAGTVVGTASLRRKAQVLARRPDLVVIPLRGNVQTRLAKLARGEVGATLLAQAGLNRLGLGHVATATLEAEEMLPAVAQGAVGIECRKDNAAILDLLGRIDHAPTHHAVDAERAFLRVLDGSCRTPIAALCQFAGAGILLRGLIASPDGTEIHATSREAAHDDAVTAAIDAGMELRRAAGPSHFA